MVLVAVSMVVATFEPTPVADMVMVACPTLSAVTTPLADTVATLGLDEEKSVVTDTPALALSTAAVSAEVAPVEMVTVAGESRGFDIAGGRFDTKAVVVAVRTTGLYPVALADALTVIWV
jgi:hypothetical protein